MAVEVATRAWFDGAALVGALDEQRAAMSLRWTGVAELLTAQTGVLRERIGDHAVCPGALVRTVRRGTMSCQYAVMLLQWLGRAPEDFVVEGDPAVEHRRLPRARTDERLRFDLPALHDRVNARRGALGLSWSQLGDEMGCTPARLTNLRTAREADMGLVLQLTQWLGLPAATFVHAVER